MCEQKKKKKKKACFHYSAVPSRRSAAELVCWSRALNCHTCRTVHRLLDQPSEVDYRAAS